MIEKEIEKKKKEIIEKIRQQEIEEGKKEIEKRNEMVEEERKKIGKRILQHLIQKSSIKII